MENNNKEIIARFYTAFQQLDYMGMQQCYSTEIVFSDPVFGLLNASAVKAMWQMLCSRAQQFSLTFGNIQLLDDEYATCEWTATYLFSGTGKMVTNKAKAYMRIQNGEITEHSDAFGFYTWSRQAFGIMGWLLGWSAFFHRKVQKKALNSLQKFMHQFSANQ